jgi:hypothetical protein
VVSRRFGKYAFDLDILEKNLLRMGILLLLKKVLPFSGF